METRKSIPEGSSPVTEVRAGLAIPGLAPFVLVAAALQAILWVLVPLTISARLIGLLLAGVTARVALRMIRGSFPRWRYVALLGSWAGLVAVLVIQIRTDGGVAEPYLLSMAILLLHGAIALLLLLRPLPWPPPSESALLAGSLVVGLVAAQAVLGGRAPQAQPGVVWEGTVVDDSVLGERYLPHSSLLIRYPSNPRGYFESRDLSMAGWSMAQLAGQAEFTPPVEPEEPMLVRIDSSFTDEPYAVQLNGPGASVRQGRGYRVHLEARSIPDRRIHVGLSLGVAPWSGLGLYQPVELDSMWRPIVAEFAAAETAEVARLHLDLGGPPGSFWARGIVLVDAETGDTLGRPSEPDFVVRYAFNEFGCRDRDYPHQAAPGTVRILGLGDSFMMGVGVHASDVLTARLREVLEARAQARGESTRYEVINCGVSGYATREERLFYEGQLRQYKPDIVLLGMVNNDDRSWTDDVAMGYMNETGRGWWLSRIWKRVTGAPTGRPPAMFDEAIWEVVKLSRAVEADGGRLVTFAFRNLPFQSGSFPDDWRTLVRSMDVGLLGSGIPFHDLGERLLAEHDADELSVHPVDIHPNEVAHRLAAEAIADILEAEGLLPGHGSLAGPTTPGRAIRSGP